jgi:Transposase DDE domain group 1
MSATLHSQQQAQSLQQPTQSFRERLRAKPFVPVAWRPTTIRLETTQESVTASAGLAWITDLFYDDPLFAEFQKCLPERKSNASYDTELFAMTTLLSILEGHDCIEDIETFRNDPLVTTKLGGEIPSAYAFGDYYRDFEPEHRERLNEFLRVFAHRSRKQVAPGDPLVIDLDSTAHVQRGLKMEGVEWNYKNQWALDTLSAWDELGFCHGMQLRPGRTFSSVGAPELISRVFRHLKHGDTKYLRCDSAFHNKKCVLTAVGVGAKFTITAHGNSLWEDKVRAGAITSWTPWQYSEEELKKAAEQKVKLPTVELGSMVYKPGWAENLRFYIVVKRTWVKNKKTGEHEWKHYGVVTNWNLFRNKLQSVIEFHNQRGNAERFIKEQKWAYDLLHFPMQKLSANHAYGLLAMVSHNLLRTIALLDNRKNPLFAKKLRRRYIHIPGKLIHSSGRHWIKIPELYRKEVERMITAWAATRQSALARAG